MLAIVAVVLFAIALVLDLAQLALGPLHVLAFIAAGLLCRALQLGSELASTSWRSSRR